MLLSLAMQMAAQQTVSGTVTDSDGNPINGATIGIKGTENKIFSNEEGKYIIAIPSGSKTLTFQYADYQVQEIEVTSNVINVTMSKNVDIFDLSLEELMNMEITTAGKKAEKISDIPASVVVVTREDIEKFGYIDLYEILSNVPGLFIIDQKEVGGKTIGVRGFWAPYGNSIIFMINGVRQDRMSSDGGFYSSNYVPVESIDRIEVIRGPMSVIYGPGAFFGAINVITNDSKESINDISFAYGNLNTIKASIRNTIVKDDLKLSINAGIYHTDGPDFKHSDMSTQNLSALTLNNSTKDIWGSQYKSFNISSEYKGFYANYNFDMNTTGRYLVYPAYNEGSFVTRTYTSASIGYKKSFLEDKFLMDGRFVLHSGDTRGEWDWINPDTTITYGGDNNIKEDYELELNIFYSPLEKLDISAGLFFRSIIESEMQTYVPYLESYQYDLESPANNFGSFLQADIDLGRKFKLIAGLRAEKFFNYDLTYAVFPAVTEDFITQRVLSQSNGSFKYEEIELLPRFAAIYKINETNILKFMYGKAMNIPEPIITGAQILSAGQPLLEPEFINTYELNYLSVIFEKLSISTSVFYNQLDNLIINLLYLDNESGSWIGLNKNAGELTTMGAELTINYNPTDNLNTQLSFTYQTTEDKTSGYEDIEVAYSPKMLGYFNVAYKLKNTDFSITGRYVDKMETYWNPSLSNPNGSFGNRIANTAEAYFLMDLNVRFNKLFKTGLYLNLHVSNLFGTKYYYPSYTLSSYWADKGLLGDERLILCTIGYKF